MFKLKSKLIIAVMVMFGITAFMSSCEKEELVYSCDTDINSWAMKNKESIRKIDIEKVYSYDVSHQKAIYRIFNAERKYELWENKLNKVKNLNWNEKEKEHIIFLIDNLKVQWFEKGVTRELDIFQKEWTKTFLDDLSLSKGLLIAIVGTLNFNVDKNNYLLPIELNIKDKESGGGTSIGNECECSVSSDYCGILECESQALCQTVKDGCGFLWTYDCNGMCGIGIGGPKL